MTLAQAKKDVNWQAWLAQAEGAIRQQKTLTEFVLSCHPDNRAICRRAFLELVASTASIRFDLWWAGNEPDSDSITCRELAWMAFEAGFEHGQTDTEKKASP